MIVARAVMPWEVVGSLMRPTFAPPAGRHVYRAVDEAGQVIDVLVSKRRDLAAARRFLSGAIAAHGQPDEVVRDLAHPSARAIEELAPDAFHNAEQYANRVLYRPDEGGTGRKVEEDFPAVLRIRAVGVGERCLAGGSA